MAVRFAYNTNGFAHHSLETCFEILAELGYVGVSLTLDVHHLNPFETNPREIADMRRRLERLGLAVTVETGARFLLDSRRKHHPPLIASEGWERRSRFLDRSIEIAAQLGGTVVTFSSGLPLANVPRDEQWRRLVERCGRLADSAARAGVVACFEPEPDFLVETLEEFGRLRDAVSHEAFGLTLDIGHAHLLETRSIADCILDHAADIRHVHVEDMCRPEHRHLAIGEGEIDFAPVVAALDSAYSGLTALELSRDSYRAPEVAEKAISLLRQHLA